MNPAVLTLLIALAPLPSGAADQPPATPAERRISSAEQVLGAQPTRFQAYNDLALALVRREREVGDPALLQEAEEAVANSLRIAPGNFEGSEAAVTVLLAEHRYREALEKAKALNHTTPDAVLVWESLSEAYEALGQYDEAEKAGQWMMDLRPGNGPAFLRGAALREDWGDINGAMEYLGSALQQTPPVETGESAWILTSMARLNRSSGKLEFAEALAEQALKTFPDYYLAIEELARVRLEQRRDADAVALLAQRNRSFPSPSSLYLYAEALERAGRAADAQTAHAAFEQAARTQIGQPHNDNRDLVLYYAGSARRPDEALRIAQVEVASRQDVWTLDAYAWALEANGRHDEARRQIDKALALGTRDAELYYHAGTIAASAGHAEAARRLLNQSLALDSESDFVEMERAALTRLGTGSVRASR